MVTSSARYHWHDPAAVAGQALSPTGLRRVAPEVSAVFHSNSRAVVGPDGYSYVAYPSPVPTVLPPPSHHAKVDRGQVS